MSTIDWHRLVNALLDDDHPVHMFDGEVWWDARGLSPEPVVPRGRFPSAVVIPPWLDSEGTTYVVDDNGAQEMAYSVDDVVRMLRYYAPDPDPTEETA